MSCYGPPSREELAAMHRRMRMELATTSMRASGDAMERSAEAIRTWEDARTSAEAPEPPAVFRCGGCGGRFDEWDGVNVAGGGLFCRPCATVARRTRRLVTFIRRTAKSQCRVVSRYGRRVRSALRHFQRPPEDRHVR